MARIVQIVKKIVVKKTTGKGKIAFIYKLIKFFKKFFKKLIDFISESHNEDIRDPFPWSYREN
jgi:predicted transcriptional regulator